MTLQPPCSSLTLLCSVSPPPASGQLNDTGTIRTLLKVFVQFLIILSFVQRINVYFILELLSKSSIFELFSQLQIINPLVKCSVYEILILIIDPNRHVITVKQRTNTGYNHTICFHNGSWQHVIPKNLFCNFYTN